MNQKVDITRAPLLKGVGELTIRFRRRTPEAHHRLTISGFGSPFGW